MAVLVCATLVGIIVGTGDCTAVVPYEGPVQYHQAPCAPLQLGWRMTCTMLMICLFAFVGVVTTCRTAFRRCCARRVQHVAVQAPCTYRRDLKTPRFQVLPEWAQIAS